jgi:hypothetical protein
MPPYLEMNAHAPREIRNLPNRLSDVVFVSKLTQGHLSLAIYPLQLWGLARLSTVDFMCLRKPSPLF